MRFDNKISLMLFFTAFIGFQEGLHGQGQDRNEEVTIIAPYKPQISDASKININPSLSKQQPDIPSPQYYITSTPVPTEVRPEPLEATRKPSEPRLKLTRNFIKAGFGNYLTPYFEFFANSRQSDEHAFGVHLKHISSHVGIKDYAFSGYSNSLAKIHGRRFLGKHTIEGDLRYAHDVSHCYGFVPVEFPGLEYDNKDIRHTVQQIGMHGGVNSNNIGDEAFNHYIDLDYNYLFNNYDLNEQNFRVSGDFIKGYDWWDASARQKGGFLIDMDYYFNKDSVSSYDGGILKIEPFFDADFEQYKFYVALRGSVKLDTNTKFHLHPVARVEVRIVEGALNLFAEIGGGISRISFRDLYTENPFISSNIHLDYTNRKLLMAAGIYGNLSQNLDYKIKISTTKTDNIPLFVTDTSGMLDNMFNVVYDNGNVFHAMAELGFRQGQNLRIMLHGDIYTFDLEKEIKPWHKPAVRISAGAEYTIKEMFKLRGEIAGQSSMNAKTFNNNEIVAKKISGWADLSFGAEFMITEQFSAFLNLNNVLNNGYFKWYNYPVQKFNLLGGVSFAF